jgi:hypothetical protein
MALTVYRIFFRLSDHSLTGEKNDNNRFFIAAKDFPLQSRKFTLVAEAARRLSGAKPYGQTASFETGRPNTVNCNNAPSMVSWNDFETDSFSPAQRKRDPFLRR